MSARRCLVEKTEAERSAQTRHLEGQGFEHSETDEPPLRVGCHASRNSGALEA
jgi:hypothetical protein